MANNEKVLNTRIKLKIATYAEWTDESKASKGANFVLKRGEIGLCEIPSGNTEATTAPTVLFKVGDGTNAFKDLKWASALAADVYAWAKKSETEFKEWACTNIDTDTDKRYSFEKVDTKTDANYGKLKITAQRYNVKTSSNIGTAAVSYVDLVTPEELEEILAGYVESVSTDSIGTITINNKEDQNDDQNPVINFNIASGNKAGNVTLTDTANGLKAEVDLSNFATKAEIPTDFGVISIDTNDDGVVELTPENATSGAVVITGAHAKKGPTNGYTSSNSVTAIGAGESKTIKLPQLTVDAYGHVNAAADEDVTITIPSLDAYATKDYVDNNEKDTKTTVSAGDYITVELTTNNKVFTPNSTNDFKVSVDEAALKTLIGKETTAAMEFKGTTSSLPTNPSNGDMWKVVDVNSSTTNNITVDGVKAKAGDAIVANVVVNDDDTKTVTWYLIPAGDSDTDTWRVLQVESSSITNTDTVNFVGGDHITVTQSPNSSDSTITDVTIALDHDYISGCTYDEDKTIGFDIYRAGVCEGESTQERLVGMVIEEGTDIEFETTETDSSRLVMATINHATINTASSNDAATLVHKGTFDAITSIATSSTGHITEIKTTTFTLPEATDISGKMDLTPDAVAGHYAMFDENGQVIDGGHIAGFTDDDIIACPPDSGNGNLSSGFTFGIAEHVSCSPDGSNLPGETPTSQNPVLRVSIAGDENYINVTRAYNDANDHAQTGNLALDDRYAEAVGQISLSDTAKASLAKADSALQEITTIDTRADHTHGTETNCGGLKITQNKDNKGDVIPGSVNIEIDDTITFIFDCGGAE